VELREAAFMQRAGARVLSSAGAWRRVGARWECNGKDSLRRMDHWVGLLGPVSVSWAVLWAMGSTNRSV
jgi:hypothetical protein